MTNETEYTAEDGSPHCPHAPPRGKVDLYGDPVVEHGTEEEYYEAYTNTDGGFMSDYSRTIFVAHYIREDGEWVQDGLDRHHVDELFNADGWPTN